MTGPFLIIIGAVALFAAIVGGGIKIRDIEVGSVTSLWRQGLLGIFGMVIGLIGLGLVVEEPGGQAAADFAAMDSGQNTTDVNAIEDAAANITEPAAAPVGPREQARDIFIRNNCDEAANVWLAYDKDGTWATDGSWTFASGEGNTLDSGGTTVATTNQDIYFYAKTDSGKEWSGNTTVGDLKNLTKANISVENDQFVLELTCTS